MSTRAPGPRIISSPRLTLRLRERELELTGGAPLIMGIVNVGDESVADRAHLRTLEEQLGYAERQLAYGAETIDIGVQSGCTDMARSRKRGSSSGFCTRPRARGGGRACLGRYLAAGRRSPRDRCRREDRLAGTLAAVNYGLSCGVQLLRVHDVGAVTEFLQVRAALLGEGEPELRGDPAAPELKWLEPKLA